tara:strand:+ start:1321 stop:1452 length:132 start_codon:yes stop_codon:yes gene_type:complete
MEKPIIKGLEKLTIIQIEKLIENLEDYKLERECIELIKELNNN